MAGWVGSQDEALQWVVAFTPGAICSGLSAAAVAQDRLHVLSLCIPGRVPLSLTAAAAFSSRSDSEGCCPCTVHNKPVSSGSQFKWMKFVLIFIPSSQMTGCPVSFGGINQVCFVLSSAFVAPFSHYEILSQKLHSWNWDVWDFQHRCCGQKRSFTFLALAVVPCF